MDPRLKEFIEYIKPFIDKATEGEYSGHNFNSYMPKSIKENIPMCFRDLVQTSISQIAVKCKPTAHKDGRSILNHMSKWYFDFLNDETLKQIPGGCEPYYMPWILFEAIKCTEAYLKLSPQSS